MSTRRTPAMYARGVYTANMPWDIPNTKVFKCVAIRGFDDLVALGIDVFKTYYEPKGLTTTEYTADKSVSATIVTLESDTGDFIYIPDTYIASYPDQTNVVCQHVVLSVSLGVLPDYLDLSFVSQQIGNLVSDVIGVTPEVKTNIAASSGLLTPEQFHVLEAARNAARVSQTTDWAKNKELNARLTALQAQYDALVAVAKNKGIIT